MAKKQDQKEELPVFDDFTEDSLFDQLEDEEDGAKGSSDNDDDDDDDDEVKSKADSTDDDDSDDDDSSSDEDDETDEDDDDDSAGDDEAKKSKSKKKSESDEDDDDDDDDEQEEETFWADVEKLTGRTVDVDYGDTDPESPEGAAVREEALVQGAINDHLDYLQKIYPREFRALEHAANGGRMEDLYNPAEQDYSKMEIGKEDVDTQKTFMSNYYQKKGFAPAKAKRMVEADEDSEEGLFKASTDALKELATNQERERGRVAKQQEAENKRSRQQDVQMISSVEKVVQSGKLEKFTVPIKEREQFYQFSLQHMQRNPNGGYMFVQPVQPNDLERQLQEMYFTYKGGDLSKIVQREVKTEGAKRLKRNVSKAGKKSGAGGDDNRQRRKGALPTMDEYNE